MDEDLDFRWISRKENDANTVGVQSPSPSSSSNIFSFLSDFMQRSPMTPLPSEEEDPLFQQQFLLYQQTLHQEYEYGTTNTNDVQPTITLPSIESVQFNFECQAPSEKDQQEDTGGISISRDSGEPNKRLKTAHSKAHNISEKRRRDRFNEKIKILQGLLPDCQRRDTASILEEAVKQIGSLKYQAQWMREHQFMPSMIPAQANALAAGMMPYPAMLQYPAAMLPQLQLQMQMQMQMMQFMRQSPQLFPPYSAASSSMAATPKIALPPNPRVPSTDQVTANASGQAETTNHGGGVGVGVGKKKKR